MKKQLIALGLASILTVPSVVLAEATWYGSFRGIVHSKGGETSMQDNGSRWGVKGSNEVSEGLTAVYRYEAALDLSSAELGENGAGRLSSLGLSGGFGTVTLGQIYSASYNHVGVLTDNGVASTNSSSTVRIGNTVSYSASTGPVSFQVDAQMESGNAESVDAAELGLSFDTGAATVGLAFRDENTKGGKTKQTAIGFSIPVGGLNLYASHTKTTEKMNAVTAENSIIICDSYFFSGVDYDRFEADVKTDKIKLTDGDPAMTRIKSKDLGLTCADHGLDNDNDPVKKVRRFHAVNSVLYKGVEGVDGDPIKTKSMHAGVSGALGDTGMSFAVNVHNYPDNNGVGENPWNAHVSKSLGGGARLAFEYIDNDDNVDDDGKKIANQALVHLQVDF